MIESLFVVLLFVTANEGKHAQRGLTARNQVLFSKVSTSAIL